MPLSKLVKWVPLGLQRPNIYQLFTLNLMKPCLKFAPEATFKQMYSTCSSFKQSFQVVRQRYGELQLESVSHLIFRYHIQTKKFGQKVMDLLQSSVFGMIHGSSIRVFSVTQQLSQGQTANLTAFMASKPFHL